MDGGDFACTIADSNCPVIEFKIGDTVLVSQQVETFADGSWGSISEVLSLPPAAVANESIAEVVISQGKFKEFLIDEFYIDYLGDDTFTPTASPSLILNPTKAPSNSPSLSPSTAPTHSPTTDKICKKNDTTGWTNGYRLKNLPKTEAPNGYEWHWEECAEECALHPGEYFIVSRYK